ncbi:MAG: hypothetical protein IPO91_06865 [Chloroflexi bacterium]|nr:hypothetical protein [Chloroflexota bacterium]
MTLQELIQVVDTLSLEERKQLVLHVVSTFPSEQSAPKYRSILEFEGFAAHLRDMDAQDYVNQLRSEWDDRP